MAITRQQLGSNPNAEAIEAWDGPLFDRFVELRHLLVDNLKRFGDLAMEMYPPRAGDRVIDVGCGFGDTTQQLAEMVGPAGSAVGVDAAPRFIEAAREEAAGVPNARFEVVDVEWADFTERFDYAFSRMGTMFFNNPVAAMRNVRKALAPGAPIVMTVWRAKEENEWMYRAQGIVERFVTKPEEYDEPTCGPGPFSLANADTTSGILLAAGFKDVTLRRSDLAIRIGRDVDEAVKLVMAIGPAGEIIRLQGDRAAHLHEPIRDALREGLSQWQTDGGVIAPASVWIVTATAP
jgi:SAM-dependent methyltransferase